ncbi:MAG: outer membrane beta-barrel protein [Pseudomonadota bacterium]
MEHRKRTIILLIAFALILTLPETAQPAGRITIMPLAKVGWQVDSNYHRAEAIEREVYTYLLQPGIQLGYQTAKSLLSLDYTLDAYYYDDRDPVPAGEQPADENNYVGHTLNLSGTTQPFDRLTIGLDESYYRTRDPAAADIFSNEVDRDKYYINRLTPRIFYEFENRFSAGLRYRYTETGYDKTTREDSTEHRGMFDLIYNFTRNTSLDLEYQYWKREYDLLTSTYTSDQAMLILRRQFRYLSLEGGAGYHKRQFDDPALGDVDLFTYRVALNGQNPPAPETNPRRYLLFSA